MTYREFAVDLAKQAGTILRRNFALGMKKEWKEDGSPLTVSDTTINRMVIDAVHKNFPGHGILAEEESARTGQEPLVWVCDPVDGTIPFSHGLPTFTFLLALVKEGQTIFGLVYDPMHEMLYVAERGQGATLNGRPIHVSDAHSINHTVIGMEQWDRAQYNLFPLIEALEQRGAFVIKPCSTGHTGVLVARGDATANIFPHTTPWDAAAVQILVKEAGGKATDLFGHDQRYDQPIKGFVASNGLIHDELLSLTGQTLQSRPSRPADIRQAASN